MSDDTPLIEDDADSDAEEAQAAALRRALEGGTGGPHLPEVALQTAALLRFSGSGGRLRDERRLSIRQELLASLPAPTPMRSPFKRWLVLALPILGGALALI